MLKVLKREDTREFYIREDANGRERKVYLPGTGEAIPCNFCGYLTEIHYHCQDDKGEHYILGNGCRRRKIDGCKLDFEDNWAGTGLHFKGPGKHY